MLVILYGLGSKREVNMARNQALQSVYAQNVRIYYLYRQYSNRFYISISQYF